MEDEDAVFDSRRTMWLNRLERWTEWPLTVLAVVLTGVLIAPHVSELSASNRDTLRHIDELIWGVFAADLVVKVAIAPHRLSYLRRRWFDLLLVVLPMFRTLRLARSLRVLRLITILRAAAAAGKVVIVAGQILGRRGMQYVLLFAMVVVVIAGALVTVAERGAASANILTLSDGLWWAVTTVTTVGYGDRYPTTSMGRGIGVALMLLGITLFGVITAHLAAVFVEDQDDAVAARLAELVQKVTELEELTQRQHLERQ